MSYHRRLARAVRDNYRTREATKHRGRVAERYDRKAQQCSRRTHFLSRWSVLRTDGSVCRSRDGQRTGGFVNQKTRLHDKGGPDSTSDAVCESSYYLSPLAA